MDRSNREQVDGQAGFRNRNISQGTEDGSSRYPAVRKLPFLPRSVFAAGTAKRTAEAQKRNTPLFSVDEEESACKTGKETCTETIKFIKGFIFFESKVFEV